MRASGDDQEVGLYSFENLAKWSHEFPPGKLANFLISETLRNGRAGQFRNLRALDIYSHLNTIIGSRRAARRAGR